MSVAWKGSAYVSLQQIHALLMRQWLVRPAFAGWRLYSTSNRPPSRYNFNKETSFSDEPDKEVLSYPTVTARDLASLKDPPREVKMLMRDFIEDSLYNPNYGYFSKRATIFSLDESKQEGFNFSAVKHSRHFQGLVGERYKEYLDQSQSSIVGSQVWHTPTELFKPWYGQAVARCLVSEYLLKYFPYEDLVIYETGAGNGTLALNVLDFLASEHPEVYERTQYNIVEISASLAKLQQERLAERHPCVKIYNQSIFDWKTTEHAPCFVVALEVVDNFPHDAVRYDMESLRAYETLVTISADNEFSEIYQPISDPLIKSYLTLRRSLLHTPPIPLFIRSPILRAMYRSVPFSPNLSKSEYLPTRLLSFIRALRAHFPRHKLLLSDFSSLPDTAEGYNAPVVQTRLQGETVPCSTPLVRQGYFDIFFPTNFDHLRDMYELVMSRPVHDEQNRHDAIPDSSPRSSPLTGYTASPDLGARFFFSKGRRRPMDGIVSGSGLPVGQRQSEVYSHKEFLETYAQLEMTRLRSGENPMVDYYKNVKFLF